MSKSPMQWLCGATLSVASVVVHGQAFDCVVLEDDNTNILVPPSDCFLNPAHVIWCNCVRSLFTHPVKGEISGFNQAVEWVMENPGIGNHRVEVEVGTLDLSGLSVGDVIGGTVVDELIPQSVGVPPGAFFVLRAESVVTAVAEGSIEFDVNFVESSSWARLIVGYDPTDEEHANGNFYKGRLTSLGAGDGFVAEYRFANEHVGNDPESHAGAEIGDVTGPGFTVRFLFSFFTTESGIYTLPDDDEVEVRTTLRRFFEDGMEAILPLGAEDLCEELETDADPCKIIDELLQIKNDLLENSPPTAVITPLDPDTLALLEEPATAEMRCDRARVLFRGANSDDGDGGVQGLSFRWSVLDGPEGGASVPEETREFQDAEVTFTIIGTYEIGLVVDDGAEADNTDATSIEVDVFDTFNLNVQPTAVIETDPSPPSVDLVAGRGTVTLDGSLSSNGFFGEDDCEQTLAFSWRQVDGPDGVTADFVAPTEPITAVEFRFPGSYTFELEVDDGASDDNTATEQVEVEVFGDPAGGFRRGDTNDDGTVDIADSVFLLNFLFTGGAGLTCPDAGDADDNAHIEITDGIRILNFLFLGAEPPLPPGPAECGTDPTEDALDECSGDAC